jgi:hypothetical protein
MPLGTFERDILRLLAQNRNPDSFVAGATVLHQAEKSPRISRDIDLFHDAAEAISAAVQKDVATLQAHGFIVEIPHPQPAFQRGFVSQADRQTKIEWLYDSAFRFFPVEPDVDLGYRLNFWDAATNKLLALAGRNEFRDYLDVLWLDQHHLSLGALAWAASGKDAGLTPDFLLEEAQRNSRFAGEEVGKLELAQPLDLVALKRQWLAAISAAKTLVAALPPEELGCLYLDARGVPRTPDPRHSEFPKWIRHFGSIKGAWPKLGEGSPLSES